MGTDGFLATDIVVLSEPPGGWAVRPNKPDTIIKNIIENIENRTGPNIFEAKTNCGRPTRILAENVRQDRIGMYHLPTEIFIFKIAFHYGPGSLFSAE